MYISNKIHYLFQFPSNHDITDADEQKEFETGPLSILLNSVKQNTQVDTTR